MKSSITKSCVEVENYFSKFNVCVGERMCVFYALLIFMTFYFPLLIYFAFPALYQIAGISFIYEKSFWRIKTHFMYSVRPKKQLIHIPF
jgi:hypothetical protein